MKNFKRTMLFFVTCTLTQHSGTVNAATNFANLQNQTSNGKLTPVVFNTAQQESLDQVTAFTNTISYSMRKMLKFQNQSQQGQGWKLIQCCGVARNIGSYIQLNYKNILGIFQVIDKQINVDYNRFTRQGTSQEKLNSFLGLKEQYNIVEYSIKNCIAMIDKTLNVISNISGEFINDKNKQFTDVQKVIVSVTKVKLEFDNVHVKLKKLPNIIIFQINKFQEELALEESKKKQIKDTFQTINHKDHGQSGDPNKVTTHVKPHTDTNKIDINNAEYKNNNNIQENNSDTSENKEKRGGGFTYVKSLFNNAGKKVFQWVGSFFNKKEQTDTSKT